MKVWIQHHNNTPLPILLEESPIASGGEGSLYKIKSPSSHQHLVAKIYHPNRRTKLRHEKILYLQATPPKGFRKKTAITLVWPQALVSDKEGHFMGFLMPWVAGEKLELLCLPNLPKKHSKTWHDFDFNVDVNLQNRLDLCYKIALAIQHIHDTERYILIDLKPDNIMVSPEGNVALVDLDSVEVVEEGITRYDAPVATPEYTPPDSYLNNNLVDPTQETPWDCFGMAVIFYKMLLGVHPYAASALAPYDQYNSLYEKIEQGLFVHNPILKGQFAVIPELHDRYHKLPSSIQQLFERCFIKGHHQPFARPSAEEWVQVLRAYNKDRIVDESKLKIPPLALHKIPHDLDLEQLFTLPMISKISQAPKIQLKKPLEKQELQNRQLPIAIQNPEVIRSQRFFNFIVLLLIMVTATALSIIMPWYLSLIIGSLAYLGFNYSTYKTRKSADQKETVVGILNKQLGQFKELIQIAEDYEAKISDYVERIKRIQENNPIPLISNLLKNRGIIQEKIDRFFQTIRVEKQKLVRLKRTEKARFQELTAYYQKKIQTETKFLSIQSSTLRQTIALLKRQYRLGSLSREEQTHYKDNLHTLEALLIQQELEQIEQEEQYWEKTQDIIYRCQEEHQKLIDDIQHYHQSISSKEEAEVNFFIEKQRINRSELKRLQYDLQQLEKPLHDQVAICRQAQQNAELYKKINYGRHLLEMVGLVKPF
ncbi:protein kinase domain-containing protein [Aureispira anguillae]|uniref:Protein kinase domain-containing protein n=1 Tax=Aureispira anguillae TaxID=2864201 RepID=A0A915YIT6_9BACT|nr:hypothetical protein [Aureispira anguillae]BDS13638.1 hypothetical protein AsAng_0043770 [Aureispira anguillae]